MTCVVVTLLKLELFELLELLPSNFKETWSFLSCMDRNNKFCLACLGWYHLTIYATHFPSRFMFLSIGFCKFINKSEIPFLCTRSHWFALVEINIFLPKYGKDDVP